MSSAVIASDETVAKALFRLQRELLARCQPHIEEFEHATGLQVNAIEVRHLDPLNGRQPLICDMAVNSEIPRHATR